jgi:hypothetical protein
MSTLHSPASRACRAIAICLRLFALSIGALGSPTASSAYSATSGAALPERTVKTPLLKKARTAILGSVSLSTNDGTRLECERVHRAVMFRRFCDGRHRHRVQTARLALSFRPVARLAQNEESGRAGGEARGRGGVGQRHIAGGSPTCGPPRCVYACDDFAKSIFSASVMPLKRTAPKIESLPP